MKTGVVYLKVRLELNMDIDEDDIPNLINDLDYDIKDGKGLVANKEIVDYSIGF